MTVLAVLIGLVTSQMWPIPTLTDKLRSILEKPFIRVREQAGQLLGEKQGYPWIATLTLPILLTGAVWLLLRVTTFYFIKFLFMIALSYMILSLSRTWSRNTRAFWCLRAHDLEMAVYLLDGSESLSCMENDALDEQSMILRSLKQLCGNLEEDIASPLFFMIFGGLPLMVFVWSIQQVHRLALAAGETDNALAKPVKLLYTIITIVPSRLFSLCEVAAAGLMRVRVHAALRVFGEQWLKQTSLCASIGEASLGLSPISDDGSEALDPEPHDLLRINHLTFFALCVYILMLLFLKLVI